MNHVQTFRERALAPHIQEALRNHPVVVLVGARQTGKSTLAQRVEPGRAYVTLDEIDRLDQARRDPEALLAAAPRLTIDEVQRAPDLFLAIKREIDQRRAAGRFLLTGSASLSLFSQMAGALAGRAAVFTLYPLTISERAGAGGVGPWEELLVTRTLEDARDHFGAAPKRSPWEAHALESGFPPAMLMASQRARWEWFEAYVSIYLERDLRQVSHVADLADFRRLMSIAALRTGRIANQSEIARDAGLSQPTAHRYLNLLEATGLLVRLQPWAANPTRRLVKTPKLYWVDGGLAAFLSRLRTAEELRSSTSRGSILENLVLADLLAWRELQAPRPDLSHWRQPSGLEVDFVVEAGRRVLPIEVKSSARVTADEVRGMSVFLDEIGSRAPFGVVLYDGAETRPLTSRVLLLPLSHALRS